MESDQRRRRRRSAGKGQQTKTSVWPTVAVTSSKDSSNTQSLCKYRCIVCNSIVKTGHNSTSNIVSHYRRYQRHLYLKVISGGSLDDKRKVFTTFCNNFKRKQDSIGSFTLPSKAQLTSTVRLKLPFQKMLSGTFCGVFLIASMQISIAFLDHWSL